jgi:hypothetical protein
VYLAVTGCSQVQQQQAMRGTQAGLQQLVEAAAPRARGHQTEAPNCGESTLTSSSLLQSDAKAQQCQRVR